MCRGLLVHLVDLYPAGTLLSPAGTPRRLVPRVVCVSWPYGTSLVHVLISIQLVGKCLYVPVKKHIPVQYNYLT